MEQACISARTKCDILQNNIAETFNSFILEARDKPILTMCEIIRRMLMKRFISKREGMKNYNGPICPRIQTKLEIAKKESGKFITYMTGDGRFEVDDAWGMRRVVDLHQRSCSCFKWDLTGIPCEHSIACIYKMRGLPEDYVHFYYKRETFLKAYEPNMLPLPGEEDWPKTNNLPCNPPIYKNAVGRPRKARKKAIDEPTNPYKITRVGQTIKCSNCGASGHNVRRCKGPLKPNRKIFKRKQFIAGTNDHSQPS